MTIPRRTQSQRRAATQQALLDSACRLFGERGYGDTALEDIAADCGLTTRPIYHYFGNKQSLFAAVNTAMETRIIARLDAVDNGGIGLLSQWRRFLDLCESDPGFRRIVLIDSPNILGRDRWQHSPVLLQALAAFQREPPHHGCAALHREIQARMILAALAEAALMIAEVDDTHSARLAAEQVVAGLAAALATPES